MGLSLLNESGTAYRPAICICIDIDSFEFEFEKKKRKIASAQFQKKLNERINSHRFVRNAAQCDERAPMKKNSEPLVTFLCHGVQQLYAYRK